MNKNNLAFGFLMFFAALLLAYNLGKPFWGQFDWTGAWFGTIARNYLEMGLIQTKLSAITVAGTANPKNWEFYNHYTPIYPLITAAFMSVFGIHEFSIRLVPVIFSLLTLLAFYKLSAKFLDSSVGLFGVLAMILTPMYIYYGKLPVHEQPVIFFSLLGIYYYLSWLSSETRKNLLKMFIFLGLAFAISWTGAFMLVLISLHLFFTNRGKIFKLIPGYLLIFLICLLHFAHILITSDIHDFMFAISDRRSTDFTLLDFLKKQLNWFFVLYSKPFALLAIISVCIELISNQRAKKITLSTQILAIFFFWGFFEWFLAPKISWIHDYMLIYFLPFVGLSLGLLAQKIFSLNKNLGTLIIICLFIFSVQTSLPLTSTLLQSADQTKTLYYLAKVLAEKTKPGDAIIVFVPNSSFRLRYPSHYLNFYANRYIKYSTQKPDFKKSGAKLIVIPQGDKFKVYESN